MYGKAGDQREQSKFKCVKIRYKWSEAGEVDQAKINAL